MVCEYNIGDNKKTKESMFGIINFSSADLDEFKNTDTKLSITGIRNYQGDIIYFDSPIEDYSLRFTENGVMLFNCVSNDFVDYIEIDDYLMDKKTEGSNAAIAKFNVSRDVVGIFTGRYNLNEDGSLSDGSSLLGGQGTSYKECLKKVHVEPTYFNSFNILLAFPGCYLQIATNGQNGENMPSCTKRISESAPSGTTNGQTCRSQSTMSLYHGLSKRLKSASRMLKLMERSLITM